MDYRTQNVGLASELKPYGTLPVFTPSDLSSFHPQQETRLWDLGIASRGRYAVVTRPRVDLARLCRIERAGEEIRTPDVQLGKLAFYH